jgi:splicing factor 3B subunit 4
MATHVADRNQESTVWVGGLEPPITEELLYELMLQAGPVVQLNMPRDPVTQLHQVRGRARDACVLSFELQTVRKRF